MDLRSSRNEAVEHSVGNTALRVHRVSCRTYSHAIRKQSDTPIKKYHCRLAAIQFYCLCKYKREQIVELLVIVIRCVRNCTYYKQHVNGWSHVLLLYWYRNQNLTSLNV